MFLVFYSTTNVFRAEEILNESNIECQVVPTPVQDKAYCGVCIKTSDARAKELVKEMEFNVIE